MAAHILYTSKQKTVRANNPGSNAALESSAMSVGKVRSSCQIAARRTATLTVMSAISATPKPSVQEPKKNHFESVFLEESRMKLSVSGTPPRALTFQSSKAQTNRIKRCGIPNEKFKAMGVSTRFAQLTYARRPPVGAKRRPQYRPAGNHKVPLRQNA